MINLNREATPTIWDGPSHKKIMVELIETMVAAMLLAIMVSIVGVAKVKKR